jgi:hypothetical protein
VRANLAGDLFDLATSATLTCCFSLFALLEHALMHDTDGCAWPAELVSDDGKRRTWHYFLIENVATALTLGVA